jgi:hypothetical protein
MDLFRRDESKVRKTFLLKDAAMMGSQQCHRFGTLHGRR